MRVQVGRALRRDSSGTRTLYRDLSPQDRRAQRNGTKCISPALRGPARLPFLRWEAAPPGGVGEKSPAA